MYDAIRELNGSLVVYRNDHMTDFYQEFLQLGPVLVRSFFSTSLYAMLTV